MVHYTLLFLLFLSCPPLHTMVQVYSDCSGDGSMVPNCRDYTNSVPPGVSFYLPHDNNCSRFWECSPNFIVCLFECAPISEDESLYFDYTKPPELGQCDWPWAVDCTMGGTTTTTTTTTTPTTTASTTTTTTSTTTTTTPSTTTTTPTTTTTTTPTTTT